ncbi:MAG: oligosaccharide repeat unit polymerase [Rhodothermales bacterium]|jgi:oligosaccharide repeat unit polymerase
MNPISRQHEGAGPVLALMTHVIVVLCLAAAYMAVDSRALGAEQGLLLVSWIVLVLSVWLVISWWIAEGSLLNPYGLFLVGSMPFHVGYALLRVMGQDSMIWLIGGVTEVELLKTMAFVTACYAILHLGALSTRASHKSAVQGEIPIFDSTRIFQVGALLLAISFIPVVLRLQSSVSTVLSGGYSSLFEAGGRGPSDGAGGVVALVAGFYLPGVMFLLAGSKGRRGGQVVAFLGLLLYSGGYLFLGFRAFSLIPIAVFVWVWHRCVRPLPILPVVASGIGLFVIVAPIVRRIRDLSGGDRLSLDVLWDAYSGADNPVLSLIAELAGSLLTITFTTELVPEARPFEMGYGYLRALTNAIPIWELPDAYGYAGSWLAWHITPEYAIGGFGFGYSFMAEAYLNFGWIGGVLMVGLIGVAIVYVQKWADRVPDPARIAFIGSFLPILIFFTRGESLSISRPILWYALIPLVLVAVLRSMDRRIAGDLPARRGPHLAPEPRVDRRPMAVRGATDSPLPPPPANPGSWNDPTQGWPGHV